MISDLLEKRRLPPVDFPATATGWWRRHMELEQLLCRGAYGRLPQPPRQLTAHEVWTDERFCAGKAPLRQVRLTAKLERGTFTFPVRIALPKGAEQGPAVVYLNFRDQLPDKYLPAEELIDRGYGVASFCYRDVTDDNSDFQSGLAGALAVDRDQPDSPGKLMLWAWAAIRVLEYLRTLPEVDPRRVAVAGHSRLAKAALLAAGLEPRFFAVLANQPGVMGGALTRGKQGERLSDAWESYPYWFCPALGEYVGREDQLPFDQHLLLALVAPRRLYVASAAQDLWSDPVSEFLCCAAADPAWQSLGVAGLRCPDRLPKVGEVFSQGAVGYHLRPGEHYLSRYEWQQFLDFLDKEQVL